MALSALKGAAKRERREYERAAQTAKWIGWFTQVDPRKQPSVASLFAKAPDRRKMTGREIGQTMRAFAARAR